MLKNLTIAIPTYNRNDYLIKLLKTIPASFTGKVVVSDNEGHVTPEIKNTFSIKFIVNYQIHFLAKN